MTHVQLGRGGLGKVRASGSVSAWGAGSVSASGTALGVRLGRGRGVRLGRGVCIGFRFRSAFRIVAALASGPRVRSTRRSRLRRAARVRRAARHRIAAAPGSARSGLARRGRRGRGRRARWCAGCGSRARSRANGVSCVLWWFFALSRNRTRHAHADRGRSPAVHPSACHGASAWGCETTTGLRSCRFSLSISPSI